MTTVHESTGSRTPSLPLRLLFVVESGADVRLVEGLAERFRLTVLARRLSAGREVSQPTSAGFAFRRGPSRRVAFARFCARDIWRARDQFDVIIVQGYSLAALAVNLVARLARLPVFMLVCSPTEAYYRCRRSNPQPGKPYRFWEAAVLATLARINARVGQNYIVLSQHLADVVRGHGARCPIHIVPVYGVDTSLFCPPRESRFLLRARRSLPSSGELLFFSSRIAPEKDSDTLLQAFQFLLNAGRNLWILHRSGGFHEFLRKAAHYGVAHRVIATDAVPPSPDLVADYQASDLCIQASREEGLGFSPLEALACRTPVVATAVGGLCETIRDGHTGWTYPVGNAPALAACIREALDHPQEAARRASLGCDFVRAGFDRRLVFDALTLTLTTAVAGEEVPLGHPAEVAPLRQN